MDIIKSSTKTICKKTLTREQWFEVRRLGIGGSDAGAIAGLNPWRSALEIYLDKTGFLPEREENEKMYWGNRLEDIVADEFTKRAGKKTRRCNYILSHPKYPWMIANIDRLIVGERAGLEIKTVSAWNAKNVKSDIPPQIYLQCQHYLAVTGYDKWNLAALIGGQEYLQREILPDRDAIEALIKIEKDFWENHVLKRIPPEPDENCGELLAMMYPQGKPEEIELPPDAHELLPQWIASKEAMKANEKLKNLAANKIKAMMGENEYARYQKYRVSWKNTSDGKRRFNIEKEETV